MENVSDFRTLFDRYYKPLCMYALHYLKDVHSAEDAVQEVFVSFWERGTEAGNERSYLYAMTRNRCVDILRLSERDCELLPADAAGVISDEEAMERSRIEANLWDAVARLPHGRRELLLMSKRDGMKYEEIAAAKGLSVNTVRNQISRALKSLKADRERIIDFILFFFTVPAI